MKRFTKKIHMAGIGGAGMSPLAEVLMSRGHCVTGSDRAVSDSTRHLETLGIKVQCGHEPSLIKGADLLVYSSAVGDDNLERVYADQNGIPAMRRAEVLGDVMRSNFTICVSGTHGKTTTTSLVGTVLTDANISPMVLVGGMLRETGSHAIVGKGGVIVAEADEYDRSFLAMYPSIAVITNIEADHLDCYRDIDDIKDAFVQFTERTPFDGAVIACIDDDGVRDILPRIRRTTVTYGVDEQADYRAVGIKFENVKTSFNVVHKNKQSGAAYIGLHGLHNVRNALAALAVACETGIEFEKAALGIAKFRGVKRRFEVTGEVGGITVVDDYAHHPSEIRATLEAARGMCGGRIVVVFQPHLYTRTRDFMEQFASSLSMADTVIVTGIYKAREEPITGVDAIDIVNLINGVCIDGSSPTAVCKDVIINKNGSVTNEPKAIYVDDKNNVIEKLRGKLNKGDMVIFMGAGDIWETARDFVAGEGGENG